MLVTFKHLTEVSDLTSRWPDVSISAWLLYFGDSLGHLLLLLTFTCT